jgi:hypothetical protein
MNIELAGFKKVDVKHLFGSEGFFKQACCARSASTKEEEAGIFG